LPPSLLSRTSATLIQIHTGDSIPRPDGFAARIEADANRLLARFAAQVTRLEIHLSGENGVKSGAAGIKCVMEARPAGYPPLSSHDQGRSAEDACRGAARKLQRLLDSTLDRGRDRRPGLSPGLGGEE
jgi:hypothetical protein